MVGARNRTYILKLPTIYNANTPYRLIFGWHWWGGNAQQVASQGYYGIEAQSGGQAIFIAADGTQDGTTGLGWPNNNGEDLAFARALLDWANANLCIDQSRIFSTGFSYGGMFSDFLGCTMPDVFRAVAPMAGRFQINGGSTANCVQRNIAAWVAHGTSDNVVPIAGGAAARDYFLNLNHCTMTSTATTPSPCVAYSGCDTGYPVHWCEFAGTHTIPSFSGQGIWAFFSQF